MGRPMSQLIAFGISVAMAASVAAQEVTPSQILITNVASEQAPVTRIAFGSCAFQWEPSGIYDTIVSKKPDLYLSLGDAIYGDYDGEKVVTVTEDSLRAEWERLGEIPSFQRLRAAVPMLATWDNHDYGTHDGGSEFALKDASERIFLDFWGVPQSAAVRTHPGVYQAYRFGPEGQRVQIILLDTKYFRDPLKRSEREPGASGSLGKYAPHTEGKAQMLGEAQWQWLETQLRLPAEVRLIASSTQIIANEKGMDEWGLFPHERERLLALIRNTGANGVILLSGNVHYAELSRSNEGPYPLYDFTSSGLTHVEAKYAAAPNRHRLAGPYAGLSFGLLDIDWDSTAHPEVRLRIISAAGMAVLSRTVSVNRLRFQPGHQ